MVMRPELRSSHRPPNGRAAHRPAGDDAVQARHAARDELARTLRDVRAEVTGGLADVKALARLQVARARIHLREFAFITAISIASAIVAVAILIAASTMLLAGIASALDAWTETNWVGDLGSGLLGLGSVAVAAVVVRRRAVEASRRRIAEEFSVAEEANR